jgi:hypothetical protein
MGAGVVSDSLARLLDLAEADVTPQNVRYQKRAERQRWERGLQIPSAEGRRMCECNCGRALPRGVRADCRYASDACRARANSRTAARRARERARNLRRQKETHGRACRYCGAADDETCWSKNESECAACNKARERFPCSRCQGPATARAARCYGCERPAWMEPVILLDAASDRERTVYRAKHLGRVEVAGWVFKVTEGEPLVVTLPTEVWVRVRR